MTGSERESGRRARFFRQLELRTGGSGVNRLELFLDLVFVYAFLSVTDLMAENFGIEGLLQGVAVILLLWRAWTSYTVVGNVVRVRWGIIRPIMFGVAATILLVGIATPVAFTDRPGALFGPLVFVTAFLLARLTALLTLTYAGWGTKIIRSLATGVWLPLCASAALLLCGALLPRHLPAGVNGGAVRLAFYFAAAVVDFIGVRAIGAGALRIASVPHWTERHRLIVLIALGETIISIGTSRGLSGGPPITWAVILGSALSLLVVAVLWWRYFDIAGLAAEQALEQGPAGSRSMLGRDAYSLLHAPMIVGLVLLALGLRRALSAVEPAAAPRWDRLSVLVLYGGALLYLLGLVALERRTIGLLGRSPLLGIALVIALLPVAVELPAVAVVGLLAAVLVSMVLVDLTVFRRRHRALHEMVASVAARTAGSGVTPKELFLDLVVVYAFIQVSVLMARHPSVVGVTQGLAVLSLLWAAWCLSAQLGNALRSESIVARLTVLLIVALTLTIGIAIPQAFERVPGGLPGPLIVVLCYLVLRVLHLAAFRRVAAAAPPAPLWRVSVSTLVSLLLLLLAALAASRPHGPGAGRVEVALWVAAIVIDFSGGYLMGPRFWLTGSAKHWTDRYELIILIALGEAILSTGVALFGRPISWSVILAIAVSMILLSSLWWAYFDTDALVGHRAVQAATGRPRGALARDAYTYLHLPMIAGLMLLAFGLHELLGLISDPAGPHAPLGHPAVFTGVILYLVATQAFWWRVRHQIRWVRTLGILLIAVLAPTTLRLPPLWVLIVLAAATAAVLVIDSRRAVDLRRRLREPSPSAILADARPAEPLR
ncbi:low temperature requirement protein A [Micromonospora soli]|uniref:low temperature requirement protein A n=1 Tax=Micromonospora sp. NBRC 110009 TaxID=3061627 RepID=UPI002672A895|nr:low temperature requirement protein A [Micromonospora sp. NBRC 110009]WKT99204.1 low temperature requirement protein A [Micromonospora sp. NBRC 110009]